MKTVTQKSGFVLRLAESAMMIAFATVLSLIKITDLPYGGSITAFSMLPIIIVAYRHGPKWGLVSGLVHGILQFLLGTASIKGISVEGVILSILIDFLLAFTVLGLGGIFRKWIKNQGLALASGVVFVSVLRFLCHFVVGRYVWFVYAPEGTANFWSYSFIYNITYMLPEMIITVIGALLISGVLDFTSNDIIRRSKVEKQPAERFLPVIIAKTTGIFIVLTGFLYALYAVINTYITAMLYEDGIDLNITQLSAIILITVVSGLGLYLLGEITTALRTIAKRHKAD